MEKRDKLAQKQLRMFDLTEDFAVVKQKFIEERKKETYARNDIFAAYI